MLTTLPARRKPASRAEHDDLILARGQIEIIDAMTRRLARAMAWIRGA